MPNRIPPDLLTLLTILVLSAVSGIVSITQRIANGHAASVMWVASELLAAVLAGYLAAETYPHVKQHLPEFLRMNAFISICAYSGGRLMQMAEHLLYNKLPGGRY